MPMVLCDQCYLEHTFYLMGCAEFQMNGEEQRRQPKDGAIRKMVVCQVCHAIRLGCWLEHKSTEHTAHVQFGFGKPLWFAQ